MAKSTNRFCHYIKSLFEKTLLRETVNFSFCPLEIQGQLITTQNASLPTSPQCSYFTRTEFVLIMLSRHDGMVMMEWAMAKPLLSIASYSLDPIIILLNSNSIANKTGFIFWFGHENEEYWHRISPLEKGFSKYVWYNIISSFLMMQRFFDSVC